MSKGTAFGKTYAAGIKGSSNRKQRAKVSEEYLAAKKVDKKTS